MWDGTKYVGDEEAPEPQPFIPSEVEVLRAQARALGDRADFVAECLLGRNGAAGVQVILKLLMFLTGGEIMRAMLMAQRMILEKMTFAEVSAMLQLQVKKILLDSGMGFMVE
ncbi:hypothetical protein AUC31_01025 [Planococcus rifietoensis]|uniref:Uncharacterized protein n=1 Tax=Planococcus rifietoensis TaxID=200991 RepID=A0A0U2Z456_9BACL|nr:hypothetical protein AUC31_01025 [Planococcus rifietoensis]